MASRFFVLNQAEETILLKQVNGRGGLQSFLRHLQLQYRRGSQELKVTDEDLENIPHYAFDYTDGGWENDLKGIFARHLGPTLGRATIPRDE